MGDLFLCKLEDSTHTWVCSGHQPGGGSHRNEAGPSSIHYAVDSGCSAHLRGQKQALPTVRLAASHLPPLLTAMPVTEAFLGHVPKAR